MKKATADKMQEYQTYTLKSLKVQLAKRFGLATLEKTQVEFEHTLDRFVDEVRVRVTTYIFGVDMPITHQVSILVPKTWWEHLKDDHFPKWWKKRWPVLHKRVWRNVVFNHWALLPGFDKVPPGYEIQMFTVPYFDEPELPKENTDQ